MHTVTWRWAKEDWEVWYRSYVQGETYRDQCRQAKTVGAVAGVFVGLLGLRLLTNWLEFVGVLLAGGLLGFAVASVYLAIYTRRSIAKLIQDGLAQYPVTESYTMSLEPEGVRFKLTGSQHLYEWSAIECHGKIHGEFLWLRIQGQDWYLPPSAFPDTELRTAFLETIERAKVAGGASPTSAPWWRQGQGA